MLGPGIKRSKVVCMLLITNIDCRGSFVISKLVSMCVIINLDISCG